MSEADSIFRNRTTGRTAAPAPEGDRTRARWQELLEHIWARAADQGRDADAFMHPDASSRTIRARLFTDRTGDTTFAVTISSAQLLEGDLQDLARRFVAAYVAAYDASWPQP